MVDEELKHELDLRTHAIIVAVKEATKNIIVEMHVLANNINKRENASAISERNVQQTMARITKEVEQVLGYEHSLVKKMEEHYEIHGI
ncbi:MAG: hypothetical protein ABIJ08_02330 [Nanoarchaeota archaeon]